MRPRTLAPIALPSLLAIALLASSLGAQISDQAGSLDDLRSDLETLKGAYDGLRSDHENLRGDYQALLQLALEMQQQLDGALSPAEVDDDFFIPRVATDFASSGLGQSFGNVYTKPFLTQASESLYIGGYIDVEFTDPSDDNDKFFDQHRLVPFIYADVSDRVKVAAEVEIEHGSEVEVEFAQIDYLFNDYFNFRAGIQLLPLGKFNEVHDSPIQDLTARPLVNRYIIPTTLRDAGVGAWGQITENVSYQATVTNGFKGLKDDGTNAITAKKGLRDAAPQKENDDLGVDPFDQINNSLAYTGRVAWQPVLGVELGASALFDKYDEAGDNDLSIYAIDATIDGKAIDCIPNNVELLGEAAWADLDRDTFAKDSGVANDMWGCYGQANIHLNPDFLDGWVDEGWVEDGAHFTLATRYDYVRLDDYKVHRATVGLNFRPNETKTVYKLDYQFNRDSGSAEGNNDDGAFLFSVATYF